MDSKTEESAMGLPQKRDVRSTKEEGGAEVCYLRLSFHVMHEGIELIANEAECRYQRKLKGVGMSRRRWNVREPY